MDSPRQQSSQAQGIVSPSILRRDVRVYDKGELVELLSSHPIRLMADGRTGAAYEGWVYPLLKGNTIILGAPAHEDASRRRDHLGPESKSITESEIAPRPLAIDRWTFESNGPVHYIKFDAADDARQRLIAQLNASGLGEIRCVRTSRRARDGRTYAWSIRLGFSGPRQECEQRVRAILEHLSSELGSVRGGRQRGRAATKSRLPAPNAEPRSGADKDFAGGTADAVEKLTFQILPPDSGVRGLAATIRKAGNFVEEELDLRRLQVLIDIERHYSERRSRRYESGFPSDEKDNRYVVLVITPPNGGEDAIAISPLRGQHATFVVRHGIARRPWKTVLSTTKAGAVEFGADRLIFKRRPDEGADEYNAMVIKIIELLDSGPTPKAVFDKKLRTRQQAPPGFEANDDVSAATVSVHVSAEQAPTPKEAHHGSELPIASVAETSRQLKDLFHYKHRYWRPAAFASILLQQVGRNDVSDDDIQPCVVPVNSLVRNVGELADLVDLVCSDVEGRAQILARYVASAPFVRLFDLTADDPTPADIAAAAKRVVGFYEANLLLAQRVRETEAPRRYRKVIESTSHLVDRNLDGVDQFIEEYVARVCALPSMERNLLGESASHIVPLNLHQDNLLLKPILRKLKVLGWMDGLWPR